MASFCQLVLRGGSKRALLGFQASQQLLFARSVSASMAVMMKRPVFEGPDYPKKPPVPPILFIMDKKDSLPTLNDNRLDLKGLSQLWKNLSSPDKMVYQEKYIQSKKRYEVQVRDFLETLGNEEDQQKYLNSLKEYRRKRREYIKYLRLKRLGIVKPSRLTAYNLFISDHRNEFMHSNDRQALKDGMIAIYGKWKLLSDSEKEVYVKRAESTLAERQTEYKKKYAEAIAAGLVKPPPEKKNAPVRKTKPAKTKKKAVMKPVKKVSTNRKKPTPVKVPRKAKASSAQ